MLSFVLASALGGKIFDARNCNAAASLDNNWGGPSPVETDAQAPAVLSVTDSPPHFDNTVPYAVGSIRIAPGSSLSFDESGTRISIGARGSGTTQFRVAAAPVTTATGEVADGCDFKCASNWLDGTVDDAGNFAQVAASLAPSHSAPCSTDDVYLPSGFGIAAHATGNVYTKSTGTSPEFFAAAVKVTDGNIFTGEAAITACSDEGSFSHVNGACLCEDDCASHAQQAEFVDAKRTALADAAHNSYDAWYKTVDGVATYTWTNVPDYPCDAASKSMDTVAATLSGAFADVDNVALVQSQADCAKGTVTIGVKAMANCGFFATAEECNNPPAHTDDHGLYIGSWGFADFADAETGEAPRVVASRIFASSIGKTTTVECHGMSDQDIQTIMDDRELLGGFADSLFARLNDYRFQGLGRSTLESSISRASHGVIAVTAQYDDLAFGDSSDRAHANTVFICQAMGFYKIPTGPKDAVRPCVYENTGIDFRCVSNEVQAAVHAPSSGAPGKPVGTAAGVAVFNEIFGITDPSNTEALTFMNELDIQVPEGAAPAASSSSDDSTTSAALFAVAGFAAVVIVGGIFMLHKTGRCGRQY